MRTYETSNDIIAEDGREWFLIEEKLRLDSNIDSVTLKITYLNINKIFN